MWDFLEINKKNKKKEEEEEEGGGGGTQLMHSHRPQGTLQWGKVSSPNPSSK